MYLFDTSIVSYVFRQHRFAALYEPELESDSPKFVSVQTIGELLTWAERNKWGAAKRGKLRALIASFGPLPIDVATAETYSSLRQDARARGRELSITDSWIMSTALRYDLILVSHDGDMRIGAELGIKTVCRR